MLLRSRTFCNFFFLISEYAGNLGEKDSSAEWLVEEREHVLQLIDKF